MDPIPLLTAQGRRGTLNRKTGWTITEERVQPADLAALSSREKDDDCHLRRDAFWFAWRYSKASLQAYKTIVARRGDTIEAAIVYREQDKRGLIAETLGSQAGLQAAIADLV
ncbi:MAG: hypothetical protein M3Y41_14520, partial [Pseudomonadota bacterium]|nr:hypothetical protein [Pseudomonadota bacterium]